MMVIRMFFLYNLWYYEFYVLQNLKRSILLFIFRSRDSRNGKRKISKYRKYQQITLVCVWTQTLFLIKHYIACTAWHICREKLYVYVAHLYDFPQLLKSQWKRGNWNKSKKKKNRRDQLKKQWFIFFSTNFTYYILLYSKVNLNLLN